MGEGVVLLVLWRAGESVCYICLVYKHHTTVILISFCPISFNYKGAMMILKSLTGEKYLCERLNLREYLFADVYL